MKAVAAIYVLALLSLVAVALLTVEESDDSVYEPSVLELVLRLLFCLVIGAVGIRMLGRGALRESLAGRASWVHMGLGVLVVPLSLAMAYLFVGLLGIMLPGDSSYQTPFTLQSFVGIAVLPALTEEWLCRGILWDALGRITSPRTTVIGTAILFAMMHGLGGGFVLELPHRFVMGLLLGWLRLRSGSLLPGIGAHFLHNFTVICIGRG